MPEHDLRRLLTREEVRRVFRIDRETLGRWIRRRWLAEAGWLPSAPPSRKGSLQVLEVVDGDLVERLEERLAREPELAESLYVAGLPLTARAEARRHLRFGRPTGHGLARRRRPDTGGTRSALPRAAARLRHALKRRFASEVPEELPGLATIAQASDSPSLAAALWTDALVDSVRAAGTALAADAGGIEDEIPSEARTVTTATAPNVIRTETAPEAGDVEDQLFRATEVIAPPSATALVDAAHAAEADPLATMPSLLEQAPRPEMTLEQEHDQEQEEELAAIFSPAPEAARPPSDAWPANDVAPVRAHGLLAIESQLARIGTALELAARPAPTASAEAPPPQLLDPAALRESLAPLVEKLGAQVEAHQRGSAELARGLAKISADLAALPQRSPSGPDRAAGPASAVESLPLAAATTIWRRLFRAPTGQLTLVAVLATAWAFALRWRLQSVYPALLALAVAVLAALLAVVCQRKSGGGSTGATATGTEA